ncbi:MAG: hypothetical protein NHB32_14440 [Fischerella sp. CENA71]|nr:hypothetical protein [Fischerella sp. CENA71]
MSDQKPRPRPRNLEQEQEQEQQPDPQPCQRIKIVDCNKPVSRVFYECYHCLQGLVSECDKSPPTVKEIKITCPNCDKTAITLIAKKVLSTNTIESPW